MACTATRVWEKGSEACPDSLFPEPPHLFHEQAGAPGEQDKGQVREGLCHWSVCAYLTHAGSLTGLHESPQVNPRTETEVEDLPNR